MEIIKYRNWEIEFNHEKTKKMYSIIAQGSSNECECEECQNFRIVKDSIYPEEIKTLFTTLGIDINKEIENYCMDPDLSKHLSAGWFHFVGKVKELTHTNPDKSLYFEEISPDFQIGFDFRSPGLVIKEFIDEPIVQVEFNVRVPWKL